MVINRKNVMEFFEGLVRLVKPETDEAKAVRVAKREVETVLKKKERELRDGGDRTASVYSTLDGFGFRWDLRVCTPSIVNRTGLESKSIAVLVQPDATIDIKYGFKEPEETGKPMFSQHLPVESRPEYRLAERSAELLAEEFGEEEKGVNNKGLSLDKRVDIAMKIAGYTTDGRFDKSLD